MTTDPLVKTPKGRTWSTIEATPSAIPPSSESEPTGPTPVAPKLSPTETNKSEQAEAASTAAAALKSAEQAQTRKEPTEQSTSGHDRELDIDFFPMLFASIQAAVITLLGNLVLSLFLALQFGAGLELRFFARIFPYLVLETDLATFQRVVFWSTVLTAALLIIFSISAFVTRRSLRVQAGRAFAWIDAALLGAMQLYRQYYLDGLGGAERWMWGLVLVGTVGFAVCSYIIWLDAKDKEEELLARETSLGNKPAQATT